MKHLKLFFALFAMLALGVGNAWAEESVVYTLTPAATGGNAAPHNSYAAGADFTCDEITWNVTGNSSMVPWRIGGKNLNNVDRTLYSKTVMPHKVTKIEVTHGTATSVTVNSFKLIVASDASFNNVISTVETTFTASATTTLSCPNGADWSNAYYKFVYNVTIGGSNKYIQFTEAKFYGEASTTPGEGGGEDPTPDPEEPDPNPGTGSSTGWVETAIGNITSSDIVVVTMTNSSGTYAMSNDKGTSAAPAAVSVTVNGDKLATEPADNLKWNITNSSGELTIYPNGDNAKWLYCTATNNGTRVGTNTNKTFTIDGTYLKHTGTSRYVGVYNSQDWRCYASSSTNISGQTLKFYKYVAPSSGGEPETPATDLTDAQFAWSAATAEATMGASNTFPTLTNTLPVSVTYESSNTAAATIAADGTITLVAPGTTTISAKFAGGEVSGTTYAAKTVSYTLTVKKAPLDPIAGGVIDILNQEWTGVSGTTYTDVAEKTAENTGHSNAKYVAQCAGDKSSIQLRSNNSNSGVVSTVSGGVVKRIEVEWHAETDAARTLQIYGSNTAYTAATDLYGDAKGELLGELNKGEGETTLDFSEWTGDYKYIGFRSKSGAMYLTTITITWLPINSKVTIDDAIQNGSISVRGAADLNAVAAGTVLTLDNTPEAGYKFVKYNVYKTDEPTTEINVENSFTMPEYDVTVSATFTSIKELDRIEVNTTNVKTTFWQGETFNSTGLVVTAYYTDETSTIVTPKSIIGSTAEAGTKQVTVSYTEGEITKETKYDITVKAIANNEETPYTVIEAREIIDAVGNTTVEVYVQGIVSKIVTAFNPNYGNISYDISADGLKTSDQLQAFRGFSYDGAWFTSADDIQVGDVVVVKGKLKIYNTTYELDEGNKLVSLVRSTEPKPTAATLPFEFDGNKDDIADVVGMSYEGLGNYSTSPKLKFDDANDNVIIHFDSEPGEFSFALKQNGQNAGTFTVYESENGEDYTSVWSGGNLGNGQTSTIESNLSSTARYVKFELTEKGSSTNYGLGQISIKKIDKRQDAGIAWNLATVSLTVGDAFTPPTFSKPNSVSVTDIEFTSSNPELATVTNAGEISLVSGKTGTATITATFAGDATYKAAEVTCTIIVNHKSEDVVILAKCKDQYYAMVAEYVEGKTDVLQALPVEYVNGKIYNIETEEQKASIIWKRIVVDGKTTFKNGDNYLSAVNSAALKLATETCDWVFEGDMYKIEGSTRTILYYTSTGGFKNYATTNMSNDGVNGEYSSAAITVAPVFADGDAYHRTTTPNKFGTICLPFGSNNYTGAEFYELVQAKADGVVLASVTTLVAGTPYIFLASATEVAVYGDGTTAATPGNSNGLYGTFTDNTEVAVGNYILKDNALCQAEAICYVNAYRAYIVMSEVPTEPVQQMPGRRYIGMSVQGENEATGFENITAPAGKTVKAIVNGQLIIIRDGEMYNAQGVRL